MVCFVAREFIKRPGEVVTDVRLFPVTLCKDTNQMFEESESLGANGFLGLSEEAEPKKDAWNTEVRDLKKKLKRQTD